MRQGAHPPALADRAASPGSNQDSAGRALSSSEPSPSKDVNSHGVAHVSATRLGDATGIDAHSGAVQAVTQFIGPFLQAVGKPRLLVALTWSHGLLNVAVIVALGLLLREATSEAQIMAIAASKIVLFLLVPLPFLLGLVLRHAGVPIADFLGSLFPSISAAVAVGLTALACMSIAGAASAGPLVTILASGIPAPGPFASEWRNALPVTT